MEEEVAASRHRRRSRKHNSNTEQPEDDAIPVEEKKKHRRHRKRRSEHDGSQEHAIEEVNENQPSHSTHRRTHKKRKDKIENEDPQLQPTDSGVVEGKKKKRRHRHRHHHHVSKEEEPITSEDAKEEETKPELEEIHSDDAYLPLSENDGDDVVYDDTKVPNEELRTTELNNANSPRRSPQKPDKTSRFKNNSSGDLPYHVLLYQEGLSTMKKKQSYVKKEEEYRHQPQLSAKSAKHRSMGDIISRTREFERQKKERQNRLLNEKLTQFNAQHTFKPEVAKNRPMNRGDIVEELYEKWMKKRIVDQQLQKDEVEYTFQPKIGSFSQNNLSAQPVFERLYETALVKQDLERDRIQKQLIMEKEKENQAAKRNQPPSNNWHESLYQRAEKRNNSLKEVQKVAHKKQREVQNSSKASDKTHTYLKAKFQHDLLRVLQQVLDVHGVDDLATLDRQTILDRITVFMVLEDLGLWIGFSEEAAKKIKAKNDSRLQAFIQLSRQEALEKRIWGHLSAPAAAAAAEDASGSDSEEGSAGGDEQPAVLLGDFLAFVLQVHAKILKLRAQSGVIESYLSTLELGPEEEESAARLVGDYAGYCVSIGVQTRSRLAMKNKDSRVKALDKELKQGETFHPVIAPASVQIENYATTKLADKSGTISQERYEILALKAKELQAKRAEIAKKNDEELAKTCPFTPQVSTRSSKYDSPHADQIRRERLYRTVHVKQEPQPEPESPPLTPVHYPSSVFKGTPPGEMSEDQWEHVDRMKKALAEKQEKQLLLENGGRSVSRSAIASHVKPFLVSQLGATAHRGPPLFQLDVKLGPLQVVKLPIYPKDNPAEIAAIFGRRHDLDQATIDMLQGIIEEQMAEFGGDGEYSPVKPKHLGYADDDDEPLSVSDLESDVDLEEAPVGSRPQAENLEVDGDFHVGSKLEVFADYVPPNEAYDHEGAHQLEAMPRIQWRRDSKTGLEIGTGFEYIPTTEDLDHFLVITYVPVSAQGLEGTPVHLTTPAKISVAAPVVVSLMLPAPAMEGLPLTPIINTKHASPSHSVLKWYRRRTADAHPTDTEAARGVLLSQSPTYTPTAEDVDHYIALYYTPANAAGGTGHEAVAVSPGRIAAGASWAGLSLPQYDSVRGSPRRTPVRA